MSIINVLGESAVRTLVLGLAVAGVLRVLRVQHVRLAKRAWTAVLVLGLAMPALVALRIEHAHSTAIRGRVRLPLSIAARRYLTGDVCTSLNATAGIAAGCSG